MPTEATKHKRKYANHKTSNGEHTHLQIVKYGFRWGITRIYNNLPIELRETKDIKYFKIEIKTWVTENCHQMDTYD